MGCSPWGSEESDTTERLHFHFSLSCIGEGNGTPLQYSCLESPMGRGAWQAVVHGIAKSQAWLSICTHARAFWNPIQTHLELCIYAYVVGEELSFLL